VESPARNSGVVGSGRRPAWRDVVEPSTTRTLYLPTAAIAAVTGWLAWYGWSVLGTRTSWVAIRNGDLRFAGPVVLGFVTIVFVLEQLWPAERRPVLARGHVMDLGYLVAYALVAIPVVTLLGTGVSTVLARHASWLVLPRAPGVPEWVFVVLGLLVIDASDWLVHLVNHKINPLWRVHAVHHSQEELSILTTFRAHPLVHLSFALTAVPGFVLVANSAAPATLVTAYACLGALPHANLRWSYGRLGRIVISPAYHRLHHRSTGRTDVNLGIVFAIWDAATGRSIVSSAQGRPTGTGLSGRPVPVEQAGPTCGLPRIFIRQWVEPFTRPRVDDRATSSVGP
jgi:sterol desaturase/sphingolipid hydroxylase (fatty acid hydroxylase superfamily)